MGKSMLVDYSEILNEELLRHKRPDEVLAAAAIVARILGYITRTVQESGSEADEHDKGIIAAFADYLESLTHAYLPGRQDETEPAPAPAAAPEGVTTLAGRTPRRRKSGKAEITVDGA